mmetsp:Transcript_48049/g.104530  ORF Transcript_48049/g.104530 Transcript_48049/m.104530 type:complete len:847 (+) Transcript_48049:28-2568(+)
MSSNALKLLRDAVGELRTRIKNTEGCLAAELATVPEQELPERLLADYGAAGLLLEICRTIPALCSHGATVALVEAFLHREDFDSAWKLYNRARSSVDQPGNLTQLLALAVRTQKWTSAVDLFKAARRVKASVDKGVCMELITKAAIKAGDVTFAFSVLEYMRQEGFATVEAHSAVVDACGSLGQPRQVVEVLARMKQQFPGGVPVETWNCALRAVGSNGRYNEADKVWKEMLRSGVTPTAGSYNALLDCAVRGRRVPEAWDLVTEMLDKKHRADKYTMSILMKSIQDTADRRRVQRGIELATRFVDQQPDDADEIVFNSLLDACVRLRDMPRLDRTLAKMKDYKVKPSAVTFGTVVKAYGQAGDYHKVDEIWQQMEACNLEVNEVTYGCMLDACVKCGKLHRALEIFDVLKSQGRHKNTVMYTTLIKGWAKARDLEAALNTFNEMRAEGVSCSAVTFNSVIDVAVRCNDMKVASELFRTMLQEHEPDLITFSTLIKGFCSLGDLAKSVCLAKELKSRGLQCDEIVYNSLLEGCVQICDLATGITLFRDMVASGIRPSNVTFSILVKLYGSVGFLDLALQLVNEMPHKHGVTPNRAVFSCLVKICVQKKSLTHALQGLELAQRAGVGAVDQSMYGTIIHSCLQEGFVQEAIQLCSAAYQQAAEGSQGYHWRPVGVSQDLLRCVVEASAGPSLSQMTPRTSQDARQLIDFLSRSRYIPHLFAQRLVRLLDEPETACPEFVPAEGAWMRTTVATGKPGDDDRPAPGLENERPATPNKTKQVAASSDQKVLQTPAKVDTHLIRGQPAVTPSTAASSFSASTPGAWADASPEKLQSNFALSLAQVDECTEA